MNHAQIDQLLQSFISEPMLLFTGKHFNAASDNRTASLHWNTVFTASQEESAYTHAFSSNERICRNIVNEQDLRGNPLDRRNLKIVRLFNTESSFELPNSPAEERLQQVNARRMIQKITEMLKYRGYLCIDGVLATEDWLLDELTDLIVGMRDECVFFFSYSEQLFPESLREVCAAKRVYSFPESLHDILTQLNETSDLDSSQPLDLKSDYLDHSYLYIDQKRVYLDRKDLRQINSFAQVLTGDQVPGMRIPKYLIESYYYEFLKSGNAVPQWYGYDRGFYIKRYFDDDLYNTVIKNLQDPGNVNMKPLLLIGQTGSGKTMSVGQLAYRVFTDRQYPVIFMSGSLSFSPTVVNESGDMVRKFSSQFIALDETLQDLEQKGARSTLLIWDCSAFLRDQEKCLQLFEALRSRGRNICLVCTSYELPSDAQLQNQIEKRFNTRFQIEVQLKEREIDAFRSILKKKARMTPEQIDEIINYLQDDGSHLLALFYTFFYHLRPPITQGVHNEAKKTIDEMLQSLSASGAHASLDLTAIGLALKIAGYEAEASADSDPEASDAVEIRAETMSEKIKDFLCITAICSKYRLAIPSSIAFRMTGAYDYGSLRFLSTIPFFVYPDADNGDFSYCIRTPLEADLLLRYFYINEKKEIELITQLIEQIRDAYSYNQNTEVRLVADLLHAIGPNANNKMQIAKYDMYYPDLIQALRQLREEQGIMEPSLALQEINLIREYYVSHASEHDDSVVAKQLREAIEIGTRVLSDPTGAISVSINDMLIVEVANSRIRLCDYDSDITFRECARARQDIEMIWRHNPDNAYTYPAWLHAALREYRYYGDGNHVDQMELLAAMCNLIDRVKLDNPRIAEDRYFITPANEVMELVGSEAADAYFEELVAAGSPAGIYIRANKMLAQLELDKVKTPYEEPVLDALKQICSDLLDNPAYTPIVSSSHECRYLLLRLKWMIYNKEPLFNRLSQYTYMNEAQWEEILSICETYKSDFIDTRVVEGYVCNSVLYILALSYAQLQLYGECVKITVILRRATEWWNRQERIKARYYICDSKGIPYHYAGEFIGDVQNNQGHVKIHDLVRYLPGDRPGVYFSRYDMKRSDPMDPGSTYPDFQLGLGYMGFSAHRGRKGERKDG